MGSSSSEWQEVTNGVRGPHFSSPSSEGPRGYDEKQVHAFLDAAGIRLAAMESTDRPAGPLVSDATVAEWAEWADSTRFSTTPRLREGYATAEVDVFRKELRDTFLGARQPPLTWDEVQRKWPGSGYHQWYPTTRGWSRLGYDVQEVDAFLKMTKLRLAAIRLLQPGSWPILRVDRPAAPPVSPKRTSRASQGYRTSGASRAPPVSKCGARASAAGRTMRRLREQGECADELRGLRLWSGRASRRR